MKSASHGMIFDCDGVLFDTKKANTIYYNSLRTHVGLQELTEEEAHFAHSATVQQALEALTPADVIPAMHEARVSIPYLETALPYIEVEDGLQELLELLQRSNKKIGIFTNRTRSGVIEIIRHFGIEQYFSLLVTCDDVPAKPSPEGLFYIEHEWGIPLKELVFVGDSMADYGAAMCTDVQFIAFRNASMPAKVHVDSFRDIIPMVGEQ